MKTTHKNDMHVCKNCRGHLASFDQQDERLTLICVRCGVKEISEHRISGPIPCWQ